MKSEKATNAEEVKDPSKGLSETRKEDIRPRAFIEAHERLDSIYSEILRLGLER